MDLVTFTTVNAPSLISRSSTTCVPDFMVTVFSPHSCVLFAICLSIQLEKVATFLLSRKTPTGTF